MIRSESSARERNQRGNAADRRARKAWMLRTWGNGVICPCVHCGVVVSAETMEADRIVPGGSYRRDNVQPSCRPCNISRSNRTDWDGAVSFAAAALAVAVL